MKESEVKAEKARNLAIIFLIITAAFLFGIYIFVILKRNISDINSEHFVITRVDYYVLSAFILALVLLLYKVFRTKIIYPIISIASIVYIFAHPYFAPIDEKSHFAYVYHVSNYHNLPTLNDYVDNEILAFDEYIYPARSSTDPSKIGFGGHIYEAFQPPLYYLLSALFYKLIPGTLIVKFYALRFFGLICILISIYIIQKTCNLLIEKQVIQRNDFLFFSTLLLFTLNPGFVLRMITVSNLHLLVPLACLFFYMLVKYSFLNDLKFKYHIIILSSLSGALVLTQFTSIFLIPLVFLFLIMNRHYKNALRYVALFIVTVLPWLIFNFYHYGRLTANKIAKNMQKVLVNPNNEIYGITHVLDRTPGMFGTFWNPQEAIYPWLKEPNTMVTDFLSVLLILVLAYSVFVVISTYKARDKGFNLLFVFTVSITLNIILLISITVLESWDMLIGRYLYLNVSSLIMLTYLFISTFNGKQKTVLSLMCIAMVILLYNNFFGKVLYEKDKNVLLGREVFYSFNLVPQNNNHTGPIKKDTKITQTFISPNGNLIGIKLFISTFRQNIKTPYKLVLEDEECITPILEKNLDISEIKDNAFLKIKFDPIHDSAGKKFCFTVVPMSETVETPITLQLSAPDIYKEGEAILNGERKKEDIVFQLVYSR